MPGTTNDKEMFNSLCKELSQIRKMLKQCTNLDDYNQIIQQYNQIEAKQELVKDYIKDHKSAKKTLLGLQSKIAILMNILNLKYEIEEQEYKYPGNDELISKAENQSDEASPHLKLTKLKPVHMTFEDQYNAKVVQVREQQLSQYAEIITKLEAKRDEFHSRYPEDSIDDVSKAYGAATQLINILNGYAQSYKIQEIDLEQLKENSSRVIQEKRNGVLGEHRGFKELMSNLLLAIGTLGIGYAVAALFTQRLTPIKCNTDTTNILVETEKVLDEIRNDKMMSI